MKIQIKPKKLIKYAILAGVGAFLLLFIITSFYIGKSVQEKCKKAQEKYEGTCTKALTKVLENENNSYRERNLAIWALGQLGNKKVVPVLEKYYTGNIPNRESLDKTISQYELKKALNLTRGGFNISALVWKPLFQNFTGQ